VKRQDEVKIEARRWEDNILDEKGKDNMRQEIDMHKSREEKKMRRWDEVRIEARRGHETEDRHLRQENKRREGKKRWGEKVRGQWEKWGNNRRRYKT